MRLIGYIAFFVLLFGGCAKEPQMSDQIVKVISSCGNSDIAVTDIKGRKKSDGFMQAQVIGENRSDSYQLLEYQVIWFDKEGFKIESILSKWNTVPAYANQPFQINAISPNTKATTFRLYIKSQKEVICDEQYNGH
ncbi:MAG: YcfL family protein [Sulfurimonas sp.]|uniref:YcfL family protein n=1 Tax=Sulfurimonas sp. TaxID=2022749 RepID=UPI0028CC1633|nr:YcfL family protein [Sulfurimonas sp.]MDT8339544.1 YcfL family protein [Sulfurimonas sp.]